ncbi:hypothetical protein TNCV_4700311 [Trichonephila clavipes]|nr:hypothetical protein TNCV_4700311 [Trichonephila clavipes]
MLITPLNMASNAYLESQRIINPSESIHSLRVRHVYGEGFPNCLGIAGEDRGNYTSVENVFMLPAFWKEKEDSSSRVSCHGSQPLQLTPPALRISLKASDNPSAVGVGCAVTFVAATPNDSYIIPWFHF